MHNKFPSLRRALAVTATSTIWLDLSSLQLKKIEWFFWKKTLIRSRKLRNPDPKPERNRFIFRTGTKTELIFYINTLLGAEPEPNNFISVFSVLLVTSERNYWKFYKQMYINPPENYSFAIVILKKMEDSEVMLLDNEVILDGIFLDPRYKVDHNQVEKAKTFYGHDNETRQSNFMLLGECNSSDSKSGPDQHELVVHQAMK